MVQVRRPTQTLHELFIKSTPTKIPLIRDIIKILASPKGSLEFAHCTEISPTLCKKRGPELFRTGPFEMA